MAIIVPELVLYQATISMLKLLDTDYVNHTNKEHTLLYRLFYGLKDAKLDYYKEAVDLFTRKEGHPRKPTVQMAFDLGEFKIPTFSVTLSSESPGPGEIGVGEYGREEHTFFDTPQSTISPSYLRRFESKYIIICSSENQNECLLMYKALQATLISISDHLELAGLQNVRLSGQEIKINGDLVPPNIYLRGVIVDTHHDVEVPRFFSVEQFNDIIIKAKTTN